MVNGILLQELLFQIRNIMTTIVSHCGMVKFQLHEIYENIVNTDGAADCRAV